MSEVDAMLTRLSDAVADVVNPLLEALLEAQSFRVRYAVVLITDHGRSAVVSNVPREVVQEVFTALASEASK